MELAKLELALRREYYLLTWNDANRANPATQTLGEAIVTKLAGLIIRYFAVLGSRRPCLLPSPKG